MRLLLLFSLAIWVAPLYSQTTSSPPVVLQDVRLIDGSGRAPVDHVSILIQNGKIARVVRGTGQTSWPRNAEVRKLSGKVVMPGLIGGHAHLGLTSGTSVKAANYTADNVKRQIAQYERYGVTTVISLGMNKDLLYQLRAEQEKGDMPGATILTADRGLGTPKGAPAVKLGADQIYRPATPDEGRKDVQAMAARDPNLIKVWIDDNQHKLPEPNPAVYAAEIDETHKQHLRIAAHVYYLADAKRLLQDGIDILAHSIRDQDVDTDTLSAIKAHEVYYIPTLQLEESFYIYAEHPEWMQSAFFRDALNPALAKKLSSTAYKKRAQADTQVHKKALETAMRNLKKVEDAGLPVAFGTDSGANPYRIAGWAEHRELELMVEAGLTPLQAIHSATEVNAKLLQLSEKTGTIAPGKQADLLVLDADPSSEITNTRKIAMVFHNGRQVKRE